MARPARTLAIRQAGRQLDGPALDLASGDLAGASKRRPRRPSARGGLGGRRTPQSYGRTRQRGRERSRWIKAAGGAADDALVDKVKGSADDLSGKGVDAVAGKSDAASHTPATSTSAGTATDHSTHTDTPAAPDDRSILDKGVDAVEGAGKDLVNKAVDAVTHPGDTIQKAADALGHDLGDKVTGAIHKIDGLSGSPPTHTDTATTTTTSGGAHAETLGTSHAALTALAPTDSQGSAHVAVSPAAIGTDHGGGFWDQAAHASNLQTAGVAGDHGSALSIMSFDSMPAHASQSGMGFDKLELLGLSHTAELANDHGGVPGQAHDAGDLGGHAFHNDPGAAHGNALATYAHDVSILHHMG